MTSKVTETSCPGDTERHHHLGGKRWRQGRTVTIKSRSGKRSYA